MARFERIAARGPLKKGMKNHVKDMEQKVRDQDKELFDIHSKAVLAVESAAKQGFIEGFIRGKRAVACAAQHLTYPEEQTCPSVLSKSFLGVTIDKNPQRGKLSTPSF